MASHGTEVGALPVRQGVQIRDVFAWGATLVHGERTTGEDNAMMLVRFDDGRVATCDVSWSSKGGLEGRFEVYGTAAGHRGHRSRLARGFHRAAGRLIVEKADADTGWVFPVPTRSTSMVTT